MTNKNLKFLSIILYISSILTAQFFDERDFLKSDLTWKDSIPENMPLIKKPFWSEEGLFRKFNIAPESRYEELIVRKNMMQWHQKLALLNLGLMSYQYYLGKEMDQGNVGGDQYTKYQSMHKKLGYTTYTLYMTSAGLSIFSPPALKYDKKLSSMKLHRYLAVIHFTAMSVQPWLGYKLANCDSNVANECDDYLDMHKKTGEVLFTSYFLAFLLTLMES